MIVALLSFISIFVGTFLGLKAAEYIETRSIRREALKRFKMSCKSTGGSSCEMIWDPRHGFEERYRCARCGRVHEVADPVYEVDYE